MTRSLAKIAGILWCTPPKYSVDCPSSRRGLASRPRLDELGFDLLRDFAHLGRVDSSPCSMASGNGLTFACMIAFLRNILSDKTCTYLSVIGKVRIPIC